MDIVARMLLNEEKSIILFDSSCTILNNVKVVVAVGNKTACLLRREMFLQQDDISGPARNVRNVSASG